MGNAISRRNLLAAAGGAAAATAAGFPFTGCARGPQAPPNIILIVSDAMRADRLSRKRDGRSITPNLDALAAAGAVYTDCYSPSSWTKTSMASILTGMYPPYHGVLAREATIPKKCDTIADMLKRHGYTTCAVQTNPWLAPEAPTVSTQGKPVRTYGFHKGFDTYIQLMPDRKDRSVEQPAYADAVAVNNRVEGVVQRTRPPYFLYVHYMETHQPYIGWVPREFTGAYCSDRGGRSTGAIFQDDQKLIRKVFTVDESEVNEAEKVRLREIYDESVRYVDYMIASMLETVRANLGLENTIVIFTADHGDEFYEHGALGHAKTVYQEVLRVPYIIKGPGIAPGKISGRVSNVNIYETIKSFACPSDDVREQTGRPLDGSRRGGRVHHEVIFAQLHALSDRFRLSKVVDEDFRSTIVHDDAGGTVTGVEVYNLAEDPGEMTPLPADGEAAAAVVMRFERDVAALARKHDVLTTRTSARWQLAYNEKKSDEEPERELTEEEKRLRDQLKALGYLN